VIRLECEKCPYEVEYPDWFLPVLISGAKTNGIGGYQCPKCKHIKLKTRKVRCTPNEEAPA